MDLDDQEYRREVENFLLGFGCNFRMLVIRRNQSEFSRDYMNHAAQCASGRFVWALNDDVENTTPGWDDVLRGAISSHEFGGHLYISVDDSTHTVDVAGRGILIDQLGTCFPMISKSACEAINGIFPPKVNVWGADSTLFKIFKHFPHRIVNCVKLVKLLHHSHNNFTREQDETSQTGIQHSRDFKLTHVEEMYYVKRLRETCE